jgi:predicted transcriptional regulator
VKISDIIKVLNAEVLFADDELLDTEVTSACASDMMSDVLAYVKDQAVLVTGLCNPQVVRTAEMMDMVCIVLVRGKTPDGVMLKLAKERRIALLSANVRMFAACGMLYEAGLKPEGGNAR